VDIDDGKEDFEATAAFLSQDLNWIKGFQEHNPKTSSTCSTITCRAGWSATHRWPYPGGAGQRRTNRSRCAGMTRRRKSHEVSCACLPNRLPTDER
jgi:hypothetical protein